MSNVLLPVDTRRQLLRALKTRYQAASKAEKTWSLEEFILISGYHRKSAIRLLNGAVTNGANSVAQPRLVRFMVPPFNRLG
ncbi:hypothetical protein APX81_02950 [Escherichia coli]|uniref:hypothetical protein n=1 Tax=Escherichia coli TaxID=562 RepID=UPI000BB0A15E|nr:hypothetical protein [Escherichia coli]EAC1404080.1 hypothetical protein [Escherichia coli]EAC1404635.1 hypothetical protein [Escherichia coli]EFN9260020.1 hypothetical protein [Escherichia coli]EFN9260969.1 hypothetical protein [Escherichia coli]EHB0476334.1 hypothetical protein [Escherichia coli]